MAKKEKKQAESPQDVVQKLGDLEKTIVSQHCQRVMNEFAEAVKKARVGIEKELAPLWLLARKYDVNIEQNSITSSVDSLVVNVRFNVNADRIRESQKWVAMANLLEKVGKLEE